MSDRFLPKRDNVNAVLENRDVKYHNFITVSECKIAYTHSDGDRREMERVIHDHGHAVAVLPVDRERRVALMVRQLRAGAVANNEPDPMLLEPAAGLIDEGETPQQAVLREAHEELGFNIKDLMHVSTLYTSPGAVTEKVHTYLASYSLTDRVHEGGGLVHEDEDIIVEEIALDELGEAALQGKFRHVIAMILIQSLMLSEPELFF